MEHVGPLHSEPMCHAPPRAVGGLLSGRQPPGSWAAGRVLSGAGWQVCCSGGREGRGEGRGGGKRCLLGVFYYCGDKIINHHFVDRSILFLLTCIPSPSSSPLPSLPHSLPPSSLCLSLPPSISPALPPLVPLLPLPPLPPLPPSLPPSLPQLSITGSTHKEA